MSARKPSPESVRAVAAQLEQAYDIGVAFHTAYAIDTGKPIPLLVRWADLTPLEHFAFATCVGEHLDFVRLAAVGVSAMHNGEKP